MLQSQRTPAIVVAILALLLGTLPTLAQSVVNPVSAPIVNSGLEFHVQAFATVPPRSNGSTARLNCLTHIDGRIFVVASLDGLIYEVTDGNVRLFFDVKAALVANGISLDTTNAQHGGVRSVTFDPDFAFTGVFYTSEMQTRPSSTSGLTYLSDANNPIGADSVVSQWRSSQDGTVQPSSRREMLRIGMPVYDHPIKQIAFNPYATVGSPDYGLLYITHGDGSVQSATAGGGRNNDGLGKVLRIRPRLSGAAYSIPDGSSSEANPFINDPNMVDEVYSLGHRNPHNIAFAKDGTVIVIDVGRDNVDEVNILRSGADFGWSEREGTFVHLQQGGLLNGVTSLPANDAQFGFTYPSAQVGHFGSQGAGYVGQALAGGYVIENGSTLSGQCFYGEFATFGDVYHSSLQELRSAVTTGDPAGLAQAATNRVSIFFDHDSNSNTGNQPRNSLLDVFNDSPQYDANSGRADTRFGQGPAGELYVMSKRNNTIYLVSNSIINWSGNGYTALSINKGVESNLSGWTSNGDFPASRLQRNWSPDQNDPNEGGLGSRYLSVNTNNVGFGQYVSFQQASGARHILACQGYKNGGWAAFGVTYYDAGWNELSVQRQRFGYPTGSSRGNGDGMRPYSLGVSVPTNAAHAYIWVWNADGGELAIDEFGLTRFQPASSTNLIVNGNFATGANPSNSFGSVRYSGQDFWELGDGDEQDDNSIYHGGSSSGLFASLQMLGEEGKNDLIYQRVEGIQGGQAYTLRTNYLRGLNFETGGPPAVSGIDFFDASGNKVGAQTTSLNSTLDYAPFDSTSRSFTAPGSATVGYAWVWLQASPLRQGLRLQSISLEP